MIQWDSEKFVPKATSLLTCSASIWKTAVNEAKYVERVEDFYQFDDHNNCERIYNEIIKYQQQVNKDKLK